MSTKGKAITSGSGVAGKQNAIRSFRDINDDEGDADYEDNNGDGTEKRMRNARQLRQVAKQKEGEWQEWRVGIITQGAQSVCGRNGDARRRLSGMLYM